MFLIEHMKNTHPMLLWSTIGFLIVITTYVVFDRTHSFYKLSWVGVRFFDEGKYSRALPYLLGAYRMNPEDKVITWKLVWAYQKLGRDSEARRILEEVNARYPADPKLSESLGDVAYSAQAYDIAQRNYQRVLARKPSATVRKKYINALFAQKKYIDAINQMDILLARMPDDQQLRFQHAQIISAIGDHERAVRELESLLDNGFDKKEVVIMLADELRLLGRDEEAIKIYEGVNHEK